MALALVLAQALALALAFHPRPHPSPNPSPTPNPNPHQACLDEGVGNITSALRRSGILGETLIWFQTDNGAATPACGGWTGGQNWPLRGGKCTAWEGGLRGSAFVWGAGIGASVRGTTAPGIMHTVDVLPTLIAALGGDAPALAAAGFPLDGVSQWAVLSRGDTGARQTVLSVLAHCLRLYLPTP